MATAQGRPNVSTDLIWEVVRSQNAYLVKRRSGGGVQFSRDPLNLTNRHNRKHAGFINEKAVGLQENEKGGLTMVTTKFKDSHRPDNHHHIVHFNRKSKGNPRLYKSIADHTAKNQYRADLNRDAITRASAIRQSQKPLKNVDRPQKLRGAKARKAAEKE